MALFCIFSGLAVVSLGLNLWQWFAACRFPLHQPVPTSSQLASVTLLKPLKGFDAHTEACLRSWLAQEYPAPLQVLFGVKEPSDPVCALARRLVAEFPQCNARLVICPESPGANPKVSTLIQLESLIEGEVVVVSDSDVMAPQNYLKQAMTILQRDGVGLVNSFYRLANPENHPTWIEAIAINCDFWPQVCQSNSIRPMKFALGAVMASRRETLEKIGGFKELVDYIADDNRLGLLVHRTGQRVELTNAVVDCYSAPMTLKRVWDHQLRWARTIRACEPMPFFFSVLSNLTVWLFFVLGATLLAPLPERHRVIVLLAVSLLLMVRCKITGIYGRKLGCPMPGFIFLVPLVLAKDALNLACWLFAFLGNGITWRDRQYRIICGGRLRAVD
jgi:ceramide glucosyltransferase